MSDDHGAPDASSGQVANPTPLVPTAPAAAESGNHDAAAAGGAIYGRERIAAGGPANSNNSAEGIGTEGETTVWEGHYSNKNFVGRAISWGIFTVAWSAMAYQTWVAGHQNLRVLTILLGIVLGVLWVGLVFRMIQARLSHKYRLTTRRLFVSTGISNRENDQLELLRVQDVFTRQSSLLQRMLGVGNVIVVSDQKAMPDYTVLGVDDPQKIHDLIWHHARAEQDQRTVRVDDH